MVSGHSWSRLFSKHNDCIQSLTSLLEMMKECRQIKRSNFSKSTFLFCQVQRASLTLFLFVELSVKQQNILFMSSWPKKSYFRSLNFYLWIYSKKPVIFCDAMQPLFRELTISHFLSWCQQVHIRSHARLLHHRLGYLWITIRNQLLVISTYLSWHDHWHDVCLQVTTCHITQYHLLWQGASKIREKVMKI